MGKLVEALRPNPFDQLEESTLNAGLPTGGESRFLRRRERTA
jgi:hypothetical protein